MYLEVAESGNPDIPISRERTICGSVSRTIGIEALRNPDISTSTSVWDIGRAGSRNLEVDQPPDVGISKYLNRYTPKFRDVAISQFRHIAISGKSGSRNLETPMARNIELPNVFSRILRAGSQKGPIRNDPYLCLPASDGAFANT